MAPEDALVGVSDFEQDVRGVDGYTMPATQHDLWLWVAGHAYAKVFDVTKEAIQALAPLAILALEMAGQKMPETSLQATRREFISTPTPKPQTLLIVLSGSF